MNLLVLTFKSEGVDDIFSASTSIAFDSSDVSLDRNSSVVTNGSFY